MALSGLTASRAPIRRREIGTGPGAALNLADSLVECSAREFGEQHPHTLADLVLLCMS